VIPAIVRICWNLQVGKKLDDRVRREDRRRVDRVENRELIARKDNWQVNATKVNCKYNNGEEKEEKEEKKKSREDGQISGGNRGKATCERRKFLNGSFLGVGLN